MNLKIKWIVLLICIVSFLLPGIVYSFNLGLGYDEGVMFYSSWLTLNGQKLYGDFFQVMQKTPGVVFTLAPFISTFNNDMNAVIAARAFSLIVKLITGLMIYGIATRIWNRKAGIWALVFFSLSSIGNAVSGLIWTETFSAFFITLAVYISLRYKDNLWKWIISGSCWAAAVLFKQSAVFLLLLFIGIYLIEEYDNIKRKKTFISRKEWGYSILSTSGLFLLGATLTFVPMIIYLYQHNLWVNFYKMVFDFNQYHPASASLWRKIGRFLKIMLNNPEVYLLGAIVAVKLVKYKCWRFQKGIKTESSQDKLTEIIVDEKVKDKGIKVVVLWFILTLSFSLLIPKETFEHYFYESLPALSILLGIGAYFLIEIKSLPRWSKGSILAGLVAISILLNIVNPIYNWNTHSEDQQMVQTIKDYAPNEEIFTDHPKYLFLTGKNQDFYFLASQEKAYNLAGLNQWEVREIQDPEEYIKNHNITLIIISKDWENLDYFVEHISENIIFFHTFAILSSSTESTVMLRPINKTGNT
ncbi:MAG: glycosyltransferase family 39 protein [Candidatus Woesearchaeota archaeon]